MKRPPDAHEIGLRSNATMLYGHIETNEERVDRLKHRLRRALYASGQKNFPSCETFMHGIEGRTPPSDLVALFNRKPRG